MEVRGGGGARPFVVISVGPDARGSRLDYAEVSLVHVAGDAAYQIPTRGGGRKPGASPPSCPFERALRRSVLSASVADPWAHSRQTSALRDAGDRARLLGGVVVRRWVCVPAMAAIFACVMACGAVPRGSGSAPFSVEVGVPFAPRVASFEAERALVFELLIRNTDTEPMFIDDASLLAGPYSWSPGHEVGYLSYDARHADLLFEVVTRHYERGKSILLTTNKPFAEWPTTFPNAACVVTLVDRLLHRAEVVAMEGDSYRLRDAEERQKARATSRKRAKDGAAASALLADRQHDRDKRGRSLGVCTKRPRCARARNGSLVVTLHRLQGGDAHARSARRA